MKIAFIGYGSMAEALASKWVGKHSLFVGGRSVDKAKALANKLGAGVGFGSEAQAAAFAEVIGRAGSYR